MRAMEVLQQLRSVAPPCVIAAILRTWWNAWCTSRRFQQHSFRNRGCVWGCATEDGDSLEHYAVCPRLQDFGARFLRLPREWELRQRRLHFFVLDSRFQESDGMLLRAALRTAAAYKVHNAVRCGTALPPVAAAAALDQAARELVTGHARATNILDSTWRTS